jgi:hypothetical protein
MSRYLVLLLDAGGVPRNSSITEHTTDEDALTVAKAILEPGQSAEVWRQNQLIGRVSGKRLRDPRQR